MDPARRAAVAEEEEQGWLARTTTGGEREARRRLARGRGRSGSARPRLHLLELACAGPHLVSPAAMLARPSLVKSGRRPPSLSIPSLSARRSPPPCSSTPARDWRAPMEGRRRGRSRLRASRGEAEQLQAACSAPSPLLSFPRMQAWSLGRHVGPVPVADPFFLRHS
ncbi:unnamed protein product [Urochloa humidicola]